LDEGEFFLGDFDPVPGVDEGKAGLEEFIGFVLFENRKALGQGRGLEGVE